MKVQGGTGLYRETQKRPSSLVTTTMRKRSYGGVYKTHEKKARCRKSRDGALEARDLGGLPIS